MIKLRDYQVQTINDTRSAFKQGYNKIIVVSPCGSGKTIMFAYMADQHIKTHNNAYVWFLVHRKELVDQTVATFINNDIPMDNVFIGMVQTITRHIDRYKKPTMIICDECHHSAAKTYTRILEAYKNVPVIGLTATPQRLDGKPLGNIFNYMVIGVSTEWLIENKYLAPYKYYAPKMELPNSYRVKMGDYVKEDVMSAMDKPKIYGKIVDYIDINKQGILYAPSIEFSKKIVDTINDTFGSKIAVHFDGETPKKERDKIVRDFRQGKIKILSNVDLIGEGFDVPDAEVCYLCRPTLSVTLYIQQSMRCMRYKPNKIAYIYDFVGNVFKHGMPSDDRKWSLENKIKVRNTTDDKELIVRQCQNCYRVYSGNKPICPYCGHDNKKTKAQIQQEEEAKLEEIKKVKKLEQSKAWDLESLIKLGKERGYRYPEYWAKNIIKSRRRKI